MNGNYGLELVGTGAALPARALTNDELREQYGLETSDEWISSRTGIRQRYFCGEGEGCVSLAVRAAKQALASAGITPGQLCCCVCATVSGDYATPSVACMVQAMLGLPEDMPVLDVNAACSGFLYGTAVAHGFLSTAPAGRGYALVIGCEELSRLMDMQDRNTCVLFGDGAGAAVLALSETLPYAPVLGARGDGAITIGGAGTPRSVIEMDGKAVFRFAVRTVPQCVREVLANAGLTMDDVDWVVCHQANERIIDHCVRSLGAPPEKFFKNIGRCANTSAASVPLALAEMQRDGKMTPGQTVLCVGFGGGLTWAGMLFTVR